MFEKGSFYRIKGGNTILVIEQTEDTDTYTKCVAWIGNMGTGWTHKVATYDKETNKVQIEPIVTNGVSGG